MDKQDNRQKQSRREQKEGYTYYDEMKQMNLQGRQEYRKESGTIEANRKLDGEQEGSDNCKILT